MAIQQMTLPLTIDEEIQAFLAVAWEKEERYGWTAGCALMEQLYHDRPRLYRRIAGGTYDTYRDDDRIMAFLDWLRAN